MPVAKLRFPDCPYETDEKKICIIYRISDDGNVFDMVKNEDENKEYKPLENVGKKNITRKFEFIYDECCILADCRITTIRQQSDQLLSVVGRSVISASPQPFIVAKKFK